MWARNILRTSTSASPAQRWTILHFNDRFHLPMFCLSEKLKTTRNLIERHFTECSSRKFRESSKVGTSNFFVVKWQFHGNSASEITEAWKWKNVKMLNLVERSCFTLFKRHMTLKFGTKFIKIFKSFRSNFPQCEKSGAKEKKFIELLWRQFILIIHPDRLFLLFPLWVHKNKKYFH